MRGFYSIISYLSRNIEEIFTKSLLFTIIFGIVKFTENKWKNSYFKGLYPSENFLNIFKGNKTIKNHIFHPIVVILAFAIFLTLSINPISTDLQITLAISFFTFAAGSVIVPKFFFKNTNSDSFIKLEIKDVYSIGFCLILVGIIFYFINIALVGGLPILEPSLRYSLTPIITMPITLIIPGVMLVGSTYLDRFKKGELSREQVRFRFIVLLVFSSVFLFALGYRSSIIAVFLVMIIMGYYGKVLAVWEVVIGILLTVGIIIGIGYFRSLVDFTLSTNTNPFYILQDRADFTLHVLNLLNYISGNFGLEHGALTLSAIPGSNDLGPRMIIGKLIAWRSEVSITATLIGPMLVDFGKIGVGIGMGLLGLILGIGYKILQKTNNSFYISIYALLLTYTIIGIETGISDIHVLIYFFLGLILYLANIINIRRNRKKIINC